MTRSGGGECIVVRVSHARESRRKGSSKRTRSADPTTRGVGVKKGKSLFGLRKKDVKTFAEKAETHHSGDARAA